MKNLFLTGGAFFMGILTLLLIITTAWIIYHFVKAYNSKQANREKYLRRIEYGKSMGLFTMVVGILGQIMGFSGMFSIIAEVDVVIPKLLYEGIRTTLICPIYGILIYLFSLLLWFVASIFIEKKQANRLSV